MSKLTDMKLPEFKIDSKSPRQRLTDLTIVMLFLYGVSNIVFSMPFHLTQIELLNDYYEKFLHPNTFALHRALETMIGAILSFISYRLFKRMRLAWLLAVCIIPASMVLHLFKYHDFFTAYSLVEAFILAVLLVNHSEFSRSPNPISLKVGISLALTSFTLLILNTAVGLSLIKGGFKSLHHFGASLVESVRLLFYMDTSVVQFHSRIAKAFGYSAIILNWFCIFAAMIFILKPLVYHPLMTKKDLQLMRRLLNRYNTNPISYVCVEEDKRFFFSTSGQGAIAYTVAGGAAVCAGEPICSEDGFPELVGEFITFCRHNELDICFCQASDRFLAQFRAFGFGVAKYGEEAMFYLADYNLTGSKMQKVRSAINTATRKGITTREYLPLMNRNLVIENEINAISEEWLDIKKSSELTFMLGTIGLQNPMDKRYFYALDADGRMLGFVVFTPFNGKKGYHADVTRRRKDAPIGTMEKIIIEAFSAMNAEGVEWGSLGLAPLANLRDTEEKNLISDALMEFIYENMNSFYGFKALHHYKKKYSPTHWVPRYIVFYPKVFTPKIAYAIIKAQNPGGVGDFIMTQVRGLFAPKKDEIAE